MRCFRQTVDGQWADVVERVGQELAKSSEREWFQNYGRKMIPLS